MPSAGTSVTEFLNVDLDLRAKRGLGKLVQSLAPSAFVLRQTSKEASLELDGVGEPTLEKTILGLVKLVQSLPPHALTIWNQCNCRIFNVGIQAGDKPHSREFGISKKAVSLLAKIGAEIVLTVYAPLKEEAEGGTPAPSKLPQAKKRKITRKSGLAKRRKRSR
jgi:hypothetical protein